jgi:phosphoglycolate phosphatase-like HAD superfamily hydrolase
VRSQSFDVEPASIASGGPIGRTSRSAFKAKEDRLPFKAIFFDIDGTLVDSNEQHVVAWSFAFREAGHPQEEEDIRLQIGKGGDLLIPTLAPDLSEAARAIISEHHGACFKDAYLKGVKPFPHAAELVRWVKSSGRHVVLASSAKRDELDHYVGLLGLEGMIDASTSIDDVATSKPAPDIFSTALAKVGLGEAEVIVIGDTIYDMEAAARAGIAAIGLTSGPFDETALRDAGAIAVYANVADLLENIERSPLVMAR